MHLDPDPSTFLSSHDVRIPAKTAGAYAEHNVAVQRSAGIYGAAAHHLLHKLWQGQHAFAPLGPSTWIEQDFWAHEGLLAHATSERGLHRHDSHSIEGLHSLEDLEHCSWRP